MLTISFWKICQPIHNCSFLVFFLKHIVKTACLGKIQFFHYGLISSQAIRLQGSLIISISGRNQVISYVFCMEVISKGRQNMRYYFLLGVTSCVSCPIRLQDSQIISISKRNQLIHFLHGDNFQGKGESETITSGYVWLDSLQYSISLERIKQYLSSFACI